MFRFHDVVARDLTPGKRPLKTVNGCQPVHEAGQGMRVFVPRFPRDTNGPGAVDSGLAVAGCADANSARLLAPTEN